MFRSVANNHTPSVEEEEVEEGEEGGEVEEEDEEGGGWEEEEGGGGLYHALRASCGYRFFSPSNSYVRFDFV